ncbi:hypothetical protein LSAT2_021876 [Lamellibrachia satsuma]|nr:hypothetical protein LSAT2_021876 [Lamellibrachia satsuma]
MKVPPTSVNYEVPPTSVNYEVPPMSVNYEVPPMSVNYEVPPMSVNYEVPPMSVNYEVPPMSENYEAPSMSVKRDWSSVATRLPHGPWLSHLFPVAVKVGNLTDVERTKHGVVVFVDSGQFEMITSWFLVIVAFLIGCAPKDVVGQAPCGCPPGFEAKSWYATNLVPPKMPCRCYKFVSDVASWAESVAYCMTMGATLLVIEDSKEKSVIDGKLKEIENDVRHHLMDEPEYWIGATDLMKEGTWMWITNATIPVGNFTGSWLSSGKDNFQGSQNCLAMKRLNSQSSRQWINIIID